LLLVALGLLHAVELEESGSAGVALPVKVVIGVAVTTEIQTSLLVSWAVGEGDVVVSNILKEVELLLFKEKTSSNRVHGSITPSLIEETTVLIQRLKEVEVRLAAEPRQATNFKVGPEMALVVVLTTIVTEEAHRVVRGNVLRVVLHELLGTGPKGRNGVDVFVKRENKTVLLLVLVHDAEGIVVDIAEELDRGLNTPVVLVVHHEFLSEEETRLESAHMTVADGVTVDDLALMHVLTNLTGLLLVNPFRERPVLLGNQTIMSLARAKRSGDLLELLIERLVVEEDPIIVVAAVETILDLSDGLGNLPDVLVSSESDECSVHTGTRSSSLKVVPARIAGGHRHRGLGKIALCRSVGRDLGSFGGNLGSLSTSISTLASGLLGGNIVLGKGSISLFSSRCLLARKVDVVAGRGLGNGAGSLLAAGASRTAWEATNTAARNGYVLDSGIGKEVEHSEGEERERNVAHIARMTCRHDEKGLTIQNRLLKEAFK
jgi:hypothetical protein